ncbi:MAG TPA: hypothetical protein VE172_04530 [Stackebrandtia sp.]|jgi:hypothetical protein|uniref:coiled-coil domain-containing protein n=1 Tax=Stackebrandtia sp. TaxID=2023065 RepID=UPI002D51F133|nr:hypothetical protein [Stackebrandtia sp.]HZE38059.1 hypothetical protein [Stackebrandtia sp.]
MATRLPLVLAIIAALGLLVGPVTSSPAYADDEKVKLNKKLEAANKDYVKAKKKVEAANKRQKRLRADIARDKKQIDKLSDDIGDFAEAMYMSGGLSTATAVLSAGSPDTAIDSLSTVNYLGEQSAGGLNKLKAAAEDLDAAKDSLADQIDAAKKAAAKKKKAKERAQAAVDKANGGPSSGSGGAASPFPGGGSGCSENDPTGTGGCVTPRMLHAYNEVRKAGYTRYTKCWRQESSSQGEHGLGRACDFSVSTGGFGGVASGGDKEYGNNLAGWAVNNASALEIYYVIWYNRIWMASTGWADYSSGHTGNPSQDHTNHVHISVN